MGRKAGRKESNQTNKYTCILCNFRVHQFGKRNQMKSYWQSSNLRNKTVSTKSVIVMKRAGTLKNVEGSEKPLYTYYISRTVLNITKLPKLYSICIRSWLWIFMRLMNILVSYDYICIDPDKGIL